MFRYLVIYIVIYVIDFFNFGVFVFKGLFIIILVEGGSELGLFVVWFVCELFVGILFDIIIGIEIE